MKAEASRLWHEMFRLRSYGGKRRAGDLRGAGRQGRLRLEIAVFI